MLKRQAQLQRQVFKVKISGEITTLKCQDLLDMAKRTNNAKYLFEEGAEAFQCCYLSRYLYFEHLALELSLSFKHFAGIIILMKIIYYPSIYFPNLFGLYQVQFMLEVWD
ncbi:hypothetical protein ROZALSC1DRAFT_25666 [Rozella allomycis CSF55]|uniref:Uncharacterized protein n=1 Tax=Rozella allomycis (strain CSF55) TaxID=988480 RepID=A0A4P9YA56_ROZAC|nr:hypothetical protein ROZALSC1DRAFT_25666 [Rozella allomycis CSF55]